MQGTDLSAVWQPLPGSQEFALDTRCDVTLYCGSRGPGKTDCQLMRYRSRVGRGYGPFWRGIIFDREYKDLDDLVSKSKRWFHEFGDGARFLSAKSDYKWVWPSGEELLFRVYDNDDDYWKYHGQEYPYIGWNELCKWAVPTAFRDMMSCNRSSFTLEKDSPRDDRGNFVVKENIPLEVFATTNSFGLGHNWVKKQFIDGIPYGKVVRKTVSVFNPKTKKREPVTKTQVSIFGSYRENIHLDTKYIANLEEIIDPNKRKSWLWGDWDIISGGMFDDVWDRAVHIVEPFTIPHGWRLDRSFDWGSSRPFSVGWWGESDGSDFTRNGKVYSSVKGDLYRIAEWYGDIPGQPNVGLKMLAVDVAKGIVEREKAWRLYGRVKAGPADTAIFNAENGVCIATDMAKPIRFDNESFPGVQWARADKSPGSRKTGWEACRKMLAHAKSKDGLPREYPGLFVFNHCAKFIGLFPVLPRDKDNLDDVDTDAEDHIGDETRYRVRFVGQGMSQGAVIGGY